MAQIDDGWTAPAGDILKNAGLDEVCRASGRGVLQGVVDMAKKGLPWLVSAAEVLGPAVPFFAPVFTLLTKAYGSVCAMREAVEQAHALRETLGRLSQALWHAFQEYRTASDASLLAKLKAKLEELKVAALLEETNAFLEKFTRQRTVTRFVLASSDKATVEALDQRLGRAVGEVALQLSVDTLQRVGALEVRVGLVEELVDSKYSGQKLVAILRQEHGRILDAHAEQRSQLDVYVPLRFGLRRPPLGAGDAEGELDAVMGALLLGSRRDVAALVGHGGGAGEAQAVLVQGTAGTGKSLFGWRMMQHFNQLVTAPVTALRAGMPARIPAVINLPLVGDAVRAAFAAATSTSSGGDGVQHFLVRQMIIAYNIPGLLEAFERLPPEQLLEVYNEGFVFVLDGVDELVDKAAIHKLYDMAAWRNSMFVVT